MRRASLFLVLSFLTAAALAVEPVKTPGSGAADRLGALQHRILHAAKPLTPEDRAELAEKGVVVGRALTNGRYLARVAEGRLAADERVTKIEAIEPEKKISPTARRETRRGNLWAELNIYFHDGVTFEEARTSLLAAGAAFEPFLLDFAPANRITAKVAPAAVSALAADDRVLGITGPLRYRIASDNSRSAALSHVKELYDAPYGLSGDGVTVSLFELGPAQADHPEFGGRLIVQPSVTGGNNSNRAHATHVAGTIGAAGINAEAKGMAPKVRIIQFCVRSGGSNTCKNDFMEDKDQELNKVGSLVDNNSWGYVLGWEPDDFWVWNDGDILWGAYELELTSPIDAISLDRRILFVHSAGNDGSNPSLSDWGQHRHVNPETLETIKDKVFCYSINGTGNDCPTGNTCAACETVKHHAATPYDTIGVTAAGKNTIAVGAVAQLGETVDIAGFSSRGPAKDGRVKPDVVARGFGVISTVPTNNYANNQGTSMAAPAVTGIAALLIEQYRKTFAGTNPDPVQLKALLIAGADDIGRPGPDYTYGFGLVNAKNSVDLIIADQGSGRRIRSASVGNGQSMEFPLVVEGTQNVKLVLQWGDPSIPLVPGEFIADKALVNDLDLKLIGPDGTVHLPYILDKVNFEAPATRGVNTVDNTEVVELKNAPAGVYRAVVSGTTVPEGPQRAILVSSVRTAAPCADITESRNNDASNAYGDLVPNQTVFAALCAANDVDFFRWRALPGAASVSITTGDTPLRVTVSGGLSGTVNVPANSTRTIEGTVGGSGASQVLLRVEAQGAPGAEPFYHFTPKFTQENAPRRRSIR